VTKHAFSQFVNASFLVTKTWFAPFKLFEKKIPNEFFLKFLFKNTLELFFYYLKIIFNTNTSKQLKKYKKIIIVFLIS
jgi:hypothetical protein